MLPICNQKVPNLNSGGDINSILIKGFCGLHPFYEVMLLYYIVKDQDYFLPASSNSPNAVILTYDSKLSIRCS
jgi:hypothetical protein